MATSNYGEGDVREATGVASHDSGIVVSGMSSTVEDVLIRDIPRIISYMDASAKLGDVESAKKARDALTQTAVRNRDVLLAYGAANPRDNSHKALIDRANSLVRGEFMSEQTSTLLNPDNNPNHRSYIQSSRGGVNDNYMDLWDKRRKREADDYDLQVLGLADSMLAATQRNEEGELVHGVMPDPNRAGFNTNEFVDLATGMKESIKELLGTDATPAEMKQVLPVLGLAYHLNSNSFNASQDTQQFTEAMLGATKVLGDNATKDQKLRLLSALSTGLSQFYQVPLSGDKEHSITWGDVGVPAKAAQQFVETWTNIRKIDASGYEGVSTVASEIQKAMHDLSGMFLSDPKQDLTAMAPVMTEVAIRRNARGPGSRFSGGSSIEANRFERMTLQGSEAAEVVTRQIMDRYRAEATPADGIEPSEEAVRAAQVSPAVTPMVTSVVKTAYRRLVEESIQPGTLSASDVEYLDSHGDDLITEALTPGSGMSATLRARVFTHMKSGIRDQAERLAETLNIPEVDKAVDFISASLIPVTAETAPASDQKIRTLYDQARQFANTKSAFKVWQTSAKTYLREQDISKLDESQFSSLMAISAPRTQLHDFVQARGFAAVSEFMKAGQKKVPTMYELFQRFQPQLDELAERMSAEGLRADQIEKAIPRFREQLQEGEYPHLGSIVADVVSFNPKFFEEMYAKTGGFNMSDRDVYRRFVTEAGYDADVKRPFYRKSRKYTYMLPNTSSSITDKMPEQYISGHQHQERSRRAFVELMGEQVGAGGAAERRQNQNESHAEYLAQSLGSSLPRIREHQQFVGIKQAQLQAEHGKAETLARLQALMSKSQYGKDGSLFGYYAMLEDAIRNSAPDQVSILTLAKGLIQADRAAMLNRLPPKDRVEGKETVPEKPTEE